MIRATAQLSAGDSATGFEINEVRAMAFAEREKEQSCKKRDDHREGDPNNR